MQLTYDETQGPLFDGYVVRRDLAGYFHLTEGGRSICGRSDNLSVIQISKYRMGSIRKEYVCPACLDKKGE